MVRVCVKGIWAILENKELRSCLQKKILPSHVRDGDLPGSVDGLFSLDCEVIPQCWKKGSGLPINGRNFPERTEVSQPLRGVRARFRRHCDATLVFSRQHAQRRRNVYVTER